MEIVKVHNEFFMQHSNDKPTICSSVIVNLIKHEFMLRNCTPICYFRFFAGTK